MATNLFTKLNTLTIILVLLTSSVLSGFYINYERQRSLDILIEKGKILAKSFSSNSLYALTFEDTDQLKAQALPLFEDVDLVYLVVDISNQNILHHFGDPNFSNHPVIELNDKSFNQMGFAVDKVQQQQLPHDIFNISYQVLSEAESGDSDELNIFNASQSTSIQPLAVLHFGLTTAATEKNMQQIQKTLLIITEGIVVLAIVFSTFVTRVITTPLSKLADSIQQVRSDNLDIAIDIKTTDEIGKVAQSYNKMMQRLQKTTVSKNYVDKLFESMTDTLFVLNTENKVQTVNKALCNMLDYKESELIGAELSKILVNSEQLAILTTRNNLTPIESADVLYFHKLGHKIPVLFSAAPLFNDQGKVSGFICMAQDITELRRTQSQLEHARKSAEQANAAKSDFLANMSHELRTPLNAILGYAQILQRQQLSPIQLKGINTIQQSGDHLLSLINDILDLSKIEAGKMELIEIDFSLHSMLKRLNDFFLIRAQEKQLSFEIEYTSDLPNGVHGDEKKIMQILMNLLANAIKYTEQGGIVLKAGQFNTNKPNQTTNDEKYHLRFQVEDSGHGIKPQHLNTIFESFRQVESKNLVEGTGLGLPISQKLAQLMGSQLRVESILDKGSRFWFELELNSADIQPEMVPNYQQQIIGYQGENKTILVVDDKLFNRELMQSLLQPLSFKIVCAESGEQAINLLEQHPVDLVLMDLRMPHLDGMETTRLIRQNNTQVKIIMISASAFELNRQRCIENGSDDFIAKPFKEHELLLKIGKQLALNWDYTDPIQSSPFTIERPEQFNWDHIPDDLTLKALMDLSLRGSIDGIQKFIVQFQERRLDEFQRCKTFFELIGSLTHTFQVKALRDLIDKALKQSTDKKTNGDIQNG